MTTYRIRTEFSFKGDFIVESDSEKNAVEEIRNHAKMVNLLGSIHTHHRYENFQTEARKVIIGIEEE